MSRKPAFDKRRSRASARPLPPLSGRRASARCAASPCSAPAWPILKTISATLRTWRSAASPRRTTPRCRFARSSTMAGIPSMWPASRTTPPRRPRRHRVSCRRTPPPACCSRRASRAAAAISMWCSRRVAAPACCRCCPRHPTPTSCCCACRRCARRSSTRRPPHSPMHCSRSRSSWRSRSTSRPTQTTPTATNSRPARGSSSSTPPVRRIFSTSPVSRRPSPPIKACATARASRR